MYIWNFKTILNLTALLLLYVSSRHPAATLRHHRHHRCNGPTPNRRRVNNVNSNGKVQQLAVLEKALFESSILRQVQEGPLLQQGVPEETLGRAQAILPTRGEQRGQLAPRFSTAGSIAERSPQRTPRPRLWLAKSVSLHRRMAL